MEEKRHAILLMTNDGNFLNTCRLCGNPCEHFARSHLIPWGFFSQGQHKNDMSLFTEQGHAKRLRKGVYDDNILCDKCEHSYFHDPDTYAIQIYRDLKDSIQKTAISSFGQISKYYQFKDVDRRLLRAFFASVLWRCSVARNTICNVDIGTVYKTRIANDLINFGSFDYVDAIGVRFDSTSQNELVQGINEGCWLPQRTKLRYNNQTANGYNMYLPSYKFCVSLDQRRHPHASQSEEQLQNAATFANVSPSLANRYGDMDLMVFESEYPMSMVRQTHAICKSAQS